MSDFGVSINNFVTCYKRNNYVYVSSIIECVYLLCSNIHVINNIRRLHLAIEIHSLLFDKRFTNGYDFLHFHKRKVVLIKKDITEIDIYVDT